MASKYYNGKSQNKGVLVAYKSGKKIGQREASQFVVNNDLVLIYNTIIIYLSEQGWSDDAIEKLIVGAQQRSYELLIDEGLSFYQIQEKAVEMTGLEVNFSEKY